MKAPIPNRIIQIWGGPKELPLLGKAARANLTLLNPDFEYCLFDNARIDDFLRHERNEYRKAFDLFELPIQRYDFLRYLLVYRLGGFYFDVDVLLASGISELTAFSCVFPFERLTWSDHLRTGCGMDWEVGNYAFGAAPNHPFVLAIIENCIKAQRDSTWAAIPTRGLPRALQQELHVIYSTGPGIVSRTLAEYPDTSAVEVLFPGNVCDKDNCWNRFGKFGIHLGGGTWRIHRGPLAKRFINFLARRNEAMALDYGRQLGTGRSLSVRA